MMSGSASLLFLRLSLRVDTMDIRKLSGLLSVSPLGPMFLPFCDVYQYYRPTLVVV